MTAISKQDFHYLAHVWCGAQFAETCSKCPLGECGGVCTMGGCKDNWKTKKCETNKQKGWCKNGKKMKKNCKLTCGLCEPECVDT